MTNEVPEKADESSPDGAHWLDKHIADQAAHYGLTVKQKAVLDSGAAEFDQMIEFGIVDEPDTNRVLSTTK